MSQLLYTVGDTVKNGELTPIYKDLNTDIHLLVSGATGTGKSNSLHNIINSLINQSKIFLIDPKYTELYLWEGYKNIKGLANNKKDIETMLNKVEKLTFERFQLMRAQRIQNGCDKFEPIIVIVDECHILTGKAKSILCNIATLGRAAGVHLILATQKPSASAFPTVIREQALGRISHFVASRTSSIMALGLSGAQDIPNKKGLLFYNNINENRLESYKMPYFNTESLHPQQAINNGFYAIFQ